MTPIRSARAGGLAILYTRQNPLKEDQYPVGFSLLRQITIENCLNNPMLMSSVVTFFSGLGHAQQMGAITLYGIFADVGSTWHDHSLPKDTIANKTPKLLYVFLFSII